MAVLMTKARVTIIREGMPTIQAARLLMAFACMAFPVRVFR